MPGLPPMGLRLLFDCREEFGCGYLLTLTVIYVTPFAVRPTCPARNHDRLPQVRS